MRAPRGYSLTPLGEATVAPAEGLEEGFLALQRSALGHDKQAKGPVTITVPPTPSAGLPIS